MFICLLVLSFMLLKYCRFEFCENFSASLTYLYALFNRLILYHIDF
nr:MAG TPA: hypothetical protein [Caudoviricetes sp.]